MPKFQKLYKLLAVIGLFIASSSITYAASFSDVPDTSSDYKAIEYLKQKGVITGYSDGTFQPQKTINRAEALKMVLSATGQTQDTTTTIKFPDVKTTDWFYKYVQNGLSLGIVKGYSDGTFKPANNINIAESLKVILLTFKITVPTEVTTNPFPDVDKSVWYAVYASTAKQKQIFEAEDDGKLHGEKDITRGQFAQAIYRLTYIKDQNLDTFPLSTDWPTYTDSTNKYTIKYPYDWKKINADTQTIFWKKDEINKQISFARVYPLSATLVVARDENSNKLAIDQYVNGLQYDQTATKKQLTLNGYPFITVAVGTSGINDYYFEMPDKSILIVYTQVGEGDNKAKLIDEIRYMVGSIRYQENASTSTTTGTSTTQTSQTSTTATTQTSQTDQKEQFLTEVRKSILVKNQGKTTLAKFTDLVIIDTDTVGIGTGPVDYYYSKNYDITIKLERNSDIILALEQGKTTAF